MCRSEEVVLVGGGNSAGQAAVYLSGFAAKVRMLVRGPNLAASMSRYLIDRIEAAANIELTCETEIVGLSGSRTGWLERVRWRHAPTGAEEERTIRNVFLFIGADPATDWLRDCGVQLCPKGFVATGADITQRWVAWRPAAAAAIQRSGGLCRRRRALRLGQAGRRRHWRRRGRGSGATQLSGCLTSAGHGSALNSTCSGRLCSVVRPVGRWCSVD